MPRVVPRGCDVVRACAAAKRSARRSSDRPEQTGQTPCSSDETKLQSLHKTASRNGRKLFFRMLVNMPTLFFLLLSFNGGLRSFRDRCATKPLESWFALTRLGACLSGLCAQVGLALSQSWGQY